MIKIWAVDIYIYIYVYIHTQRKPLLRVCWEAILGGFILNFVLNFLEPSGVCWCNHNNNGNNTTRNWIILLNIISIKKGITQHNLDWGATLALFKEIQVLGWLNFITGADLLWLVSPWIQQPNKCCMARTTFAQSVEAQSSTRKIEHPPLPKISLFFSLCVLWIVVTCIVNFFIPPLFTSSLRTYLAQYLRQYILAH